MKLAQRSQSLIELTTLIVLIVVGIILIRPYVIRAVNAHFKTWEETIEDSTKEELQEALLNELPPPPVCPDGTCTAGFEDVTRCCQDCGTCNDGYCCPQKGEDNNTSPNYCPQDCGTCGDTICTPERNEDVNTCCVDCSTCGDGSCCTDLGPDVPGGTPVGKDVGCTPDCPQAPLCPNRICDPGEDRSNCCQDCHGEPACPDGTCCTDAGETSSCPADCDALPCECLNYSNCNLRPDCCFDVISPGVESPCNPGETRFCHKAGTCAVDPCAGVTCNMGRGGCCDGDCCSEYSNELGQYCGCGPRSPRDRCGELRRQCVNCNTDSHVCY